MRSGERATPKLGSIIRTAAARFRAARLAFGHGMADAHEEATCLALHALKMDPALLSDNLDRSLTAAEAQAFEALVRRRISERRPAAYLTGIAWLGGHRFRVDERTIIPRSFIAEPLQEALAPWITHPNRAMDALDLCTGSGCLAILLAKAFPRARIDAVDVSPPALAVARLNVRSYRLGRRVRVVRSDLFANLGNRRYDLIISNPPYVRERVMRRLPREYRLEPRLALAGGRDGLDFVRRILARATDHLKPGGWLLVETGHSRPRVERAFPRVPFTWIETSGGDDCVFLLNRDDLATAPCPPVPAPRRRAKPAVARPPRA